MIPALALTLSLPLPAAAPDELLPETPEGWRYERLDLPLDFAPDLGLEGFEELRFAPGMFERGSDTYFSYALALRLEGDAEVDGPFLRGFLEAYYRGLCEAVAGGRGLEVDLSEFGVDLVRDEAGFRATVDMLDAFTTGAPLRLTVLLRVHPGPDGTEVLGLASPKPAEAAVWKELAAIEERWRAARPPALLLNHVFVITDPETYAALRDSEFLRRTFAVSEERTTVRRDLTYSGLYFYGRDTYFEFLEPSPQLAEGSSGVAFGIEVVGGTQRLEETLRAAQVASFPRPTTREMDGEQVPWFSMLGVEGAHASSRLTLFTLEYAPEFLRSWHAQLPPAPVGITRRAVLERYAATIGRKGPAPLLEDVREVHLGLDAAERERLVAVARAGGYRTEEEFGVLTCFGPGVRLVVSPSERSLGITALTLALRRPVRRVPLEFGRASLSFEGETATLAFER